MRKLLSALLVCATVTGCAAAPASVPEAASTSTTATTSAAPPTTSVRSAAESERLFQAAVAEALLPADTVQTKGVQVRDEPGKNEPVMSCWASLSRLPVASFRRIWEGEPGLNAHSTHLYRGQHAKGLIEEVRAQVTKNCPTWDDPELGSFRYIAGQDVPVTAKADGVFVFCADNAMPGEPDQLFCIGYLARNGPGTTLLSVVQLQTPKMATRANKNNTALAATLLQIAVHNADLRLTKVTLP